MSTTDMNDNIGKLETPELAADFIFGGQAIFTVKSLRTGDRRTFRVRASDRPGFYFVDLLVGPQNESDYRYLGCCTNHPEPRPLVTNKQHWGEDAWKVFCWVMGQLNQERLHPMLEIWHEGRCSKCSRPLTDPESIARGIGPVCAGRIH